MNYSLTSNLRRSDREYSNGTLRFESSYEERDLPSPELGPALQDPHLAEATVRQKRRFGNCPKVENEWLE